MGRSRVKLKELDTMSAINIYNLEADSIVANFRPAEFYALLKIQANNADLCTYVLKIHLQFLRMEAYEFNSITQRWMESNCY